MKEMFLGMLAVVFLALGWTSPVSAGEVYKEEHTLVYCPPVWSADGTRVKQSYADSISSCEYGAEQVDTIADSVLQVICTGGGYECVHVSIMSVTQREKYDALLASPKKTQVAMDHVTCVYRTPDNMIVQVVSMYAHLHSRGSPCDKRNVMRTYDRRAMKACVKDGGCIPIQYVDGPTDEYSRIIKKDAR